MEALPSLRDSKPYIALNYQRQRKHKDVHYILHKPLRPDQRLFSAPCILTICSQPKVQVKPSDDFASGGRVYKKW